MNAHPFPAGSIRAAVAKGGDLWWLCPDGARRPLAGAMRDQDADAVVMERCGLQPRGDYTTVADTLRDPRVWSGVEAVDRLQAVDDAYTEEAVDG